MIAGFAFVSYPVADLERAVAFYRDVVGLRQGRSFGDEIVEFDVGDGTFSVDTQALGAPGTQVSAAFEVDDVVAMHAALVAKGVAVTDVMETPVCSMTFVTDPDGNRFGLHERKTR